MKVSRGFDGSPDRSRYVFDSRLCTIHLGWAQFDTKQDASYFGNWINPFTLQLFSYTEGDTRLASCESEEEFVDEVLRTFRWYWDNDGKKPGIDPGFNEELKAKFIQLRIGALLH